MKDLIEMFNCGADLLANQIRKVVVVPAGSRRLGGLSAKMGNSSVLSRSLKEQL